MGLLRIHLRMSLIALQHLINARSTIRFTLCFITPRRHRAMLSYLHSAEMHSTYEALRTETLIEDFEADDPKAKWVGLLEKKWTSVIRLQKKVRSVWMFGLPASANASGLPASGKAER